MTISSFLKSCRERAGLSQEKLAELLHTTQSSISKIEKGRKEPCIQTFVDWTRLTQQAEVGYAFLGNVFYGFDPAAVLQTIMQITGAA